MPRKNQKSPELKSLLINCKTCNKECAIQTDILPVTANHFIQIASTVGWRILIDDINKEFVMLCSQECFTKYTETLPDS